MHARYYYARYKSFKFLQSIRIVSGGLGGFIGTVVMYALVTGLNKRFAREINGRLTLPMSRPVSALFTLYGTSVGGFMGFSSATTECAAMTITNLPNSSVIKRCPCVTHRRRRNSNTFIRIFVSSSALCRNYIISLERHNPDLKEVLSPRYYCLLLHLEYF